MSRKKDLVTAEQVVTFVGKCFDKHRTEFSHVEDLPLAIEQVVLTALETEGSPLRVAVAGMILEMFDQVFGAIDSRTPPPPAEPTLAIAIEPDPDADSPTGTTPAHLVTVP